jgi:hypothetical protein
VPVALHVCSSPALHSVEPGEHTAHAPLTQYGTLPLHGPPRADQLMPSAAHCSGCALSHPSAFGMQSVHTPSWHVGVALEHAGALDCHVPVPSHVCGCEPSHCEAPATHCPWHLPSTHVWLEQSTGLPQAPLL